MKQSTKRILSLLLVAVTALTLLAGCGGGSPNNPAKLGSAGAFTKWFGSQKKSLTNLETPGTYYFKLTRDINLSQTAVIDNGHTVVIDLAGYTIKNKDGQHVQLFSVSEGAALTLQNGTVTSAGADMDGGVIAVSGAASALQLTDVVLSNTDDSFISETLSGGVLLVNSPADTAPATVTISGSTEINGSPAGIRRNGGAIVAKGNAEIHMYGGTIQNGQAGCSGNVYMTDHAKFYMHDGLITGGAAVGKAQTSGLGGNVDMRGQARFHLYGGSINGGSAKKYGGNIFISNFGTSDTADGFHIYGGTVEGGAAQSGGNVYATDKDSLVCIYGGEIIDGEAMSGGNVYLEGSSMLMDGGTLTGLRNSTVNAYGTNLFSNHGTVTLYDGVIQDGMSNSSGGNVYVGDTQLTMYGGTIKGGDVTAVGVNVGGSNVFATGASVFNLYGGVITRGTANRDNKEGESAAGANVMLAQQTQMHMFGGEISDGVVHGSISRGGCVYVYGQSKGNNTWFNMYGGELRNGETDGTMRGMLVGAYGESKNTLDNAGRGTARIFEGTLNFTGPANSDNKFNTMYTNRKDLDCLRVYDPTGVEALLRGATTGPCPDATHNVEVETQDATCVTHGWIKYSCATCGDWYKVTAEPLGHTETANTVEATATQAGITEHSCSACGKVRYTDVIPATGK